MSPLFLLLVAALSVDCTNNPAKLPPLFSDDSEDIVFLSEPNRSFSNPTNIALNTTYYGTFYYTGDYHVFHYSLSSSDFYIGLAANGHPIEVSYYGSDDGGVTTTFLRGHTGTSSDSNYGYEYGNYFDTSEYSDIYIKVKNCYSSSSSVPYAFTFCKFTKYDTTDFQVRKYDVATGFYSYIVHPYTYYGGPVTSGYNPNGSSAVSIPYATPGSVLNLTSANGYDTTSDFPYTAIGRIYGGSLNTSGFGTGFMIGSNIFATAGHCMVKVDHAFLDMDEVTIKFGQKSQTQFIDTAHITKVYYSVDYLCTDSSDDWWSCDWAICELDDDYGDSCGYLRTMCGNQLNYNSNTLLACPGYPGTNYQVMPYGNYTGYDPNHIFTNIQGNFGASGGPLIDYLNQYVVGILSSGELPHTEYYAFTPNLFSFTQTVLGGFVS